MQKITVEPKGNNEKYSVANYETLSESPLSGKTYFWLGSSVTEGYGACDESMVDYIEKKYSATCIKEAVSGTTLADAESTKNVGDSYVKRLDQYMDSEDAAEKLDAFICQLSTNDANGTVELGNMTDTNIKDKTSFDTTTTYGAIEYIIARVREKYNCPIIFCTNSKYNNETYGDMVETLCEMANKWDITAINLYDDESFNNISDEELALYMKDAIHPTRAGYSLWWLPKFEEVLLNL